MERGIKRWATGLLLGAALTAPLAAHAQVSVRQAANNGPYDPVTGELTGPQLDEAKGPNPFADYRLDVTFSDGQRSYTVPGYFQGCADAADRSCTGGKLWRAHFVPQHGGAWTYSVAFRTGADIVSNGGEGTPVAKADGLKGEFTVGAAPRNPVRARGLLHYTGERDYRWSGDNSLFFKWGTDAPENMLAYADFDATPNYKNLRKTWAPHARDYDASAAPYTWAKGAKGKNILGMLRYLHDQKLNSVSMLLFNVGGDDRNVVPQLIKGPLEAFSALETKATWTDGVVHDRYDVSKLDQWQRALSYADELGLHLHFKLMEAENDAFMDNNSVGRERKIYMREMVARYNHYLAVTWNLGEETHQGAKELDAESRFIAALDPYNHPLVVHTHPQQKEIYRGLLGGASALNGLSLQGIFDDYRDMRGDVIKWSRLSKAAGRQWVIASDEQGGAAGGAPVDADYPLENTPDKKRGVQIPHELFRRQVVWNVLMSGGDGAEAYYGYQTACTDLNCEDHRTRATLWRDGVKAREFFDKYIGLDALRLEADDDVTPAPEDYVLADLGKMYVIYAITEGSTGLSPSFETRYGRQGPIQLQLYSQTGRYSVQWYDALKGGDLQKTAITEVNGGSMVSLGRPPAGGSGEWAILVKRIG